MNAITTTLIGTSVQIAWTPLSSNGNSVSAYKIEILASDGTYKEDTTNCDGSD